MCHPGVEAAPGDKTLPGARSGDAAKLRLDIFTLLPPTTDHGAAQIRKSPWGTLIRVAASTVDSAQIASVIADRAGKRDGPRLRESYSPLRVLISITSKALRAVSAAAFGRSTQ